MSSINYLSFSGAEMGVSRARKNELDIFRNVSQRKNCTLPKQTNYFLKELSKLVQSFVLQIQRVKTRHFVMQKLYPVNI